MIALPIRREDRPAFVRALRTRRVHYSVIDYSTHGVIVTANLRREDPRRRTAFRRLMRLALRFAPHPERDGGVTW